MKIFLWLALMVSQTLLASDGPQNTGTLTLDASEGDFLEGHLQIDRTVITPLFGSESFGNEEIGRFVQISRGGAACEVKETIPLASDAVMTAALRFACPAHPNEVTVTLLSPERLPEGFSLGAKGAFDHFSLDRNNPQATIIADYGYLHFLAGLGFFGGNDIAARAEIGRQAALWFGGLHRAPPGLGLLLLLIAIWVMPLSVRLRATLTGLSLALAFPVTLGILSTHSVRKFFSFLYLSHTYFALVLVLFAAGIALRYRPKAKMILVPLTLIAAVLYGIETSVVVWHLEKVEGAKQLAGVSQFYWGKACALLILGLLTTAVVVALHKLAKGRWGLRHSPVIIAGLGALATTYMLVMLFLRLRI